jgi:outer membrane protein assembly factor BamE (lipoprotein component of BamABCDE complex)
MKFLLTGFALLVLLALLGWRYNQGEVFSASVRVRLKPGMTTNEVAAILGRPASVDAGHKEYTRWVYTRPLLLFKIGLVDFDASGCLQQAYND